MNQKSVPNIRDLYPHLSDEELAVAEANLDQYLRVILRIVERLESEANEMDGKLTEDKSTLVCTTPQSASAE